MFKYVCKRIGLFFVSLFIIMTMLFVLIRTLPNPVVAVTGGYARQLEDMRRAWGYYDPIIVQYGIFLKNLFTGFNWGFCTTVGTFLQPVEEYLASKIPATLYVNVLSLIFSVPLGILFGVIAAVFKNKWQDQVINVFMGSMFAMFFCFIFFGWISTSSTVRAQFYRFKGQEYVMASRTLGAKDSRLIFKHILPNASGFIITACVLCSPSPTRSSPRRPIPTWASSTSTPRPRPAWAPCSRTDRRPCPPIRTVSSSRPSSWRCC